MSVVNNPPEFSNLRVNEAIFDCEADIVDESLGTAKVMKKWFANSIEIEKKLRYGDLVRCELISIDELGEEGVIYVIEFKMLEPALKILFFFFFFFFFFLIKKKF